MSDGAQFNVESFYNVLMRVEQRLGRIEGKQEDQVGANALAEKFNRLRRDIHEDMARVEGRISDKVDDALGDARDLRAADLDKLRSDCHGIARKVFREELGEQDKTLQRAVQRSNIAVWAGGGMGGLGLIGTIYTILQGMGAG